MPVAPTDISVVICAYTEDRWTDLLAAVSSVRHQTAAPREVIVVVDHNPRLLERLRSAVSGLIVVENSQARGLSGARNSGVAASSGAVVAFLDDDAVAEPDWLAILSEGYQDPRVAGVGGSPEPLWVGTRPAWFPDEFSWVVGCSYRGLPLKASPVRNFIGANMSFRRTVFDAVGGFRAGIGRHGTRPLGCEETELCIRVRQRWSDAILLYEPRARVRHRVPETRAGWAYFRSRCYAEGLSKALVSQFVGAEAGLSSERTHALRILPRGVIRGIGDALVERDTAGLARAAAITAGLAITTMGYLTGLGQAGIAQVLARRPYCAS